MQSKPAPGGTLRAGTKDPPLNLLDEEAMTSHHPTTDEVLALFESRGHSQYGREAVTQLEHALQCGFFAERCQADAELLAAAILHDVGHLLHDLPDDAPERGVDDRHEELAAEWLVTRFGPAVIEPVRLHVAAKRYLCTTDDSYLSQLSEPSRLSLKLQGGLMSAEEVKQFQALPHWESAVTLRRCDDAAKVPQLSTPPLEHYAQFLDEAARRRKPGVD